MVSGPPGHRPVGVDYIAHKTGYSRVTIYRWRRAGHLPTPADTRPTIWPREQIDQWLNDNFDFH